MHILNIAILIGLLLLGVWQDVRHYRIPNVLVFSGAVIGVLLHTLLPQEMGGLGILTSLAGLGVGLAVLLPLYLFRAIGAGDIKLMAMIGAFVGPASMLMITVYILLAGGVLAIGVVLVRGKLSRLLDNFRFMMLMRLAGSTSINLPTMETIDQSAGKLPYGVAIATGTLIYLAKIHWG
jgi:prepilin peptidase CpaA